MCVWNWHTFYEILLTLVYILWILSKIFIFFTSSYRLLNLFYNSVMGHYLQFEELWPQTLFDIPNVSVFCLIDVYFLILTNTLLWDCKQVWFSFILKNKSKTLSCLFYSFLKLLLNLTLIFLQTYNMYVINTCYFNLPITLVLFATITPLAIYPKSVSLIIASTYITVNVPD